MFDIPSFCVYAVEANKFGTSSSHSVPGNIQSPAGSFALTST